MIKGRVADGSVAVIIDEDKNSATFNQVKDKTAVHRGINIERQTFQLHRRASL